jgi:hypothetical protein
MARRIPVLLLAPTIVAGAAVVAHRLGAATFHWRTRRLIAALDRASADEIGAPTIPPIVRSAARRAGVGNPVPNTVRLRQRAEMRANPGDSWRPHTADQVIAIHEPGFVWLARLRVAPLTHARILDAYVKGQGLLEVRLLDSLRIARAVGPQISKGELMRYLAELAWAPHALLHNPHLHWREIDATTVEVSAGSTGGVARVRLTFENGDIARIEADDRPRAVGNRTIPTRWRGRFFDYRQVGGCRVPTRAEVSWLLDEGPFACWRGELIGFETEAH